MSRRSELEAKLRELAEALAADMAEEGGLRGKTITLKLKASTFEVGGALQQWLGGLLLGFISCIVRQACIGKCPVGLPQHTTASTLAQTTHPSLAPCAAAHAGHHTAHLFAHR